MSHHFAPGRGAPHGLVNIGSCPARPDNRVRLELAEQDGKTVKAQLTGHDGTRFLAGRLQAG
ncbi:MAG TPA: hypothetical protein VGA00_14425 [Acidiferrobacterales bacterium]